MYVFYCLIFNSKNSQYFLSFDDKAENIGIKLDNFGNFPVYLIPNLLTILKVSNVFLYLTI